MEDYTGNSWDIFSKEEIDREMQVKQERHESMIESLTRENCELRLENAKLRLQLKER
jgi:regulator of replication initiation timing